MRAKVRTVKFPLLTDESSEHDTYEDNFSQVVSFLIRKYKGQRRRFSYEPYSAHPIRVADIVREYTDDRDVAVAAYLCFTIKATNTTVEEIAGVFGQRAADLIEEISPHPGKVINGRIIGLVGRINQISHNALLIILADFLDNILFFENDKDILTGEHKELMRLEKFLNLYRREIQLVVSRLQPDRLTSAHRELIDRIKMSLVES